MAFKASDCASSSLSRRNASRDRAIWRSVLDVWLAARIPCTSAVRPASSKAIAVWPSRSVEPGSSWRASSQACSAAWCSPCAVRIRAFWAVNFAWSMRVAWIDSLTNEAACSGRSAILWASAFTSSLETCSRRCSSCCRCRCCWAAPGALQPDPAPGQRSPGMNTSPVY